MMRAAVKIFWSAVKRWANLTDFCWIVNWESSVTVAWESAACDYEHVWATVVAADVREKKSIFDLMSFYIEIFRPWIIFQRSVTIIINMNCQFHCFQSFRLLSLKLFVDMIKRMCQLKVCWKNLKNLSICERFIKLINKKMKSMIKMMKLMIRDIFLHEAAYFCLKLKLIEIWCSCDS